MKWSSAYRSKSHEDCGYFQVTVEYVNGKKRRIPNVKTIRYESTTYVYLIGSSFEEQVRMSNVLYITKEKID